MFQWLYDVVALLGSLAQSSRSPELRSSEMFLVGYVHLPVLVESQMLLSLSWVELTLQAG